MNALAQTAPFTTVNPHALATILEASQTKSIIASRDIFDISGTKLWARDQPVSSALQRKLLDRQLRNPIESCLLAEDGVTPQALLLCTEALLARDTPLVGLLRPHASRIVAEVANLPLHAVAQLLLTAGQASRPESFDHAVQAMALAGALMIGHGGSTAELRVAMLAGLLHDLGEMYIDPRYGEADAERKLDFQSYQHLVVHPHVGQLLLSQLTDYPAAMARAIAEHHERLDGSGYPHALQRESVSPLGRLLAVTEATLGVLRGERPELARASIALRVVPGEFDLAWVGGIAAAAKAQPAMAGQLDAPEVQARQVRLDAALQAAQFRAEALLPMAEAPALRDAIALTLHLLGRLRTGWYASGLWASEGLTPQLAAEVEAIEDELFFRLNAIERAAHLRAGALPPADADRLDLLCDSLRAVRH
jgi:HD domain